MHNRNPFYANISLSMIDIMVDEGKMGKNAARVWRELVEQEVVASPILAPDQAEIWNQKLFLAETADNVGYTPLDLFKEDMGDELLSFAEIFEDETLIPFYPIEVSDVEDWLENDMLQMGFDLQTCGINIATTRAEFSLIARRGALVLSSPYRAKTDFLITKHVSYDTTEYNDYLWVVWAEFIGLKGYYVRLTSRLTPDDALSFLPIAVEEEEQLAKDALARRLGRAAKQH